MRVEGVAHTYTYIHTFREHDDQGWFPHGETNEVPVLGSIVVAGGGDVTLA